MATTRFERFTTVAVALLVGGGAALAIASATAASHSAPIVRPTPVAVEVVRLEPVVVTVSQAYYDGVRAGTVDAGTALARRDDAKRTTRG